MWRVAETDELTQFLNNYNQLLDRRVPECSRCSKAFGAETREWDMAIPNSEEDLFGMQSYCCYKCTKHFCYTHENGCSDDKNGILNCCQKCQKEYCEDCVKMQACGKCRKTICDGCSMETCVGCEKKLCYVCVPGKDDICACVKNTYCKSCLPDTSLCTKKGCNKVHCANCELCDDPQGEVE